MADLIFYSSLLSDIKQRIRNSQNKALQFVNEELIRLYYDVGKLILSKQKDEGWGAGVIPKLSSDIRNELPEIKGFSQRNIGYMIRFAKEYNLEILQQPVAKLNNEQIIWKIPWGHHIVLFSTFKDTHVRFWYMEQIISNGWSRNTLASMIENSAHKRQGQLSHNFNKTLPTAQSNLALQTMKDPYIFDFLTLTDDFQERELETELIKQLEKFLIELGAGFAFLGRQYKLTISDKDFYIDLLFYHIKLHCFIVIELKKGEFKPEYTGKMNFYCSAVDDLLKDANDQPTIGLILCENKDRVFAEYALKDINKPIGVSEYELTRALPDNLKSSLPSIEEIEEELTSLIDKGGKK